jgi:hypothetical protein
MWEVEWEGERALDLQLGHGRVVAAATLGEVVGAGLGLAQGSVYEPVLGLHKQRVGSELCTHHGAFYSAVLAGLLTDNISYTYTQYRHDYLEIGSPSWSQCKQDRCNPLEHLWVVWAGLLEVQQAVQGQRSSRQAWPVLG